MNRQSRSAKGPVLGCDSKVKAAREGTHGRTKSSHFRIWRSLQFGYTYYLIPTLSPNRFPSPQVMISKFCLQMQVVRTVARAERIAVPERDEEAAVEGKGVFPRVSSSIGGTKAHSREEKYLS